MNKGQASIEFLLLLLVAIIYITTVTMPVMQTAKNLIYDMENISRANTETQKIANAISAVSLLGVGSKETVAVFLPENTTITCGAAQVSFETTLTQKPFPAQCDAAGAPGKCTKIFNLEGKTITCTSFPITGPAKATLIVQRNLNDISVTQS